MSYNGGKISTDTILHLLADHHLYLFYYNFILFRRVVKLFLCIILVSQDKEFKSRCLSICALNLSQMVDYTATMFESRCLKYTNLKNVKNIWDSLLMELKFLLCFEQFNS